MPLTRSFKQTVQVRIARDPAFREELLRESTQYRLAGLTHKSSKRLMRMLGPKGNPRARNLFELIGHLQKAEGLHFELSLRK